MPLQVADIEHLPELSQPLSQPSISWSQALAKRRIGRVTAGIPIPFDRRSLGVRLSPPAVSRDLTEGKGFSISFH